jgi:hypothetical protein
MRAKSGNIQMPDMLAALDVIHFLISFSLQNKQAVQPIGTRIYVLYIALLKNIQNALIG